FLDHVIDPQTHSFRLFFEDDWRTLPEHEHVSPGHDIEGSWLLVEAAEVLGDAALLAEVEAVAVRMAEAVLTRGRDPEGAIVYTLTPDGGDRNRHWWVQAEGVVGFTNAYQLSGDERFAAAAQRCWEIIEKQFIDRRHGEWFKIVRPDGTPVAEQVKTGPWECPYHNARMGYEMCARLAPMEKPQ
ncbi:MAG: AGE family epimerase/isomerase, partial [Anaerolineales bacterium]|nr:AGE family epimerase/isomerase [Anaerolineales bacterium]